jgi:probable F420-dependent oxidoreductase
MRYFVDYPLAVGHDDGAWLDPAKMAAFARAAEAAGVEGIALTDHPAPSRKWRDNGGHDTLDPFVGLAYFAAATTTLRLMTYLTVVPYRNPFLLAKSMASVDVVSGGRATFVLGTGYLRSEFAALGADFAQRNEVFDEAMTVVRGLLGSPYEFRHEGTHFTGLGVTLSPPAVQAPHPPLWLGGNSRVVRERVAAWGNGWAPLTLGGAVMSKASRTAEIASHDDLARCIMQIKEAMTAAGRDASSLDVAAQGTRLISPEWSTDEQLTYLGELADIGVTWTSVPFDKQRHTAALDDVARFGERVIAVTR